MTMTLDEILTEYEDQWRGAALTDRRQMRGGPWPEPGDEAQCAASISLGSPIGMALRSLPVGGGRYCVECEALGVSFMLVFSVVDLMVHLNDKHRWTWDMFANKFRDALREGGVAL
jgi:hypothetical protein